MGRRTTGNDFVQRFDSCARSAENWLALLDHAFEVFSERNKGSPPGQVADRPNELWRLAGMRRRSGKAGDVGAHLNITDCLYAQRTKRSSHNPRRYRISLIAGFKEFCEQITMHGLPEVARNNNRLNR